MIVSCQPQSSKEKEKKGHHLTTISSNQTRGESDNEEEDIEQKLEKEKSDHLVRMKKKSYTFVCTDNCKGGGASMENVRKYERKQPFDIINTKTDTSHLIQFRFIDDCCHEYIGDIDIKDDTLNLTYKNISFFTCECFCEYEYQFNIQLKNRSYSVVQMNGQEFE